MTAHRTRLDVDELGDRIVPAIGADVSDAIVATNSLAVGAFRADTTTPDSTTGLQPGVGLNVINSIISTGGLASNFFPTSTTPAATTTTSTTTPTTTPTPTPTTPATHPLAGQGAGAFVNPVDPGALAIDALTTYNLTGTANLAGMGQVNVTGTLHSVGFVLTGQASGEVKFSNNRGSVTVQLTGAEQAGYSPLPSVFAYKVTARTGAFSALNDQGSLTLLIAPQLFNYVPQPKGAFAFVI